MARIRPGLQRRSKKKVAKQAPVRVMASLWSAPDPRTEIFSQRFLVLPPNRQRRLQHDLKFQL